MTPDARYPIGRFRPRSSHSPGEIRGSVDAIAETPALLRAAVAGLDSDQLATPYRDGGWTLAQVVHHLADSHLHSYLRCRFILVEPTPTVQAYDEGAWAELADARATALDLTLALIDALHARWVVLLRGLGRDAWAREYVHPERSIDTLAGMAALYAWHGRHHVAHITGLRDRRNW